MIVEGKQFIWEDTLEKYGAGSYEIASSVNMNYVYVSYGWGQLPIS